MSQLIECGCGARLRVAVGSDVAVCPQCETEHAVPPSGKVVWVEEHVPSDRPPRTNPPRYTEAMADQLYSRVAGGTRTRRPRSRKPMRAFLLGAALLVMAGLLTWYRLDIGFLRMPSVGLTIGGIVTLMKAVMGYTR